MKPTKSSILPFNPISSEPDSFVMYITPPMARYILEHHNFDNREKKATQVNKIGQSVDTFGWLFDGKAVCFNTDGNLTEKQHTLTYISRDPNDDAQYRVVITRGCVKDAFSKAAADKPRRPHDEIWRKDRSVVPSQSAILGDLLKRKGNKPSLSINNAVYQWNAWKKYIQKAEKTCNEFHTKTKDFSAQTKTIGAWATLCINAGCENEVAIFLDLLQDELLEKSSTRLTSEFVKFWKDTTWNESNEGKLKVMYRMLCIAMDRIIETPSGFIGFDMTSVKLLSPTLGGTYQKFLA